MSSQSQIDFTDDAGAVTLKSSQPTPANRFRNWTPDVAEMADMEVAVGDGVTQKFLFRRDYVVSFDIANLTQSDLSNAIRCKEHLTNGGEVAVTVGDESSHEYDCVLRPGTMPEIVFADPKMIEFTFRVQLKHVTDTALLADYDT